MLFACWGVLCSPPNVVVWAMGLDQGARSAALTADLHRNNTWSVEWTDNPCRARYHS